MPATEGTPQRDERSVDRLRRLLAERLGMAFDDTKEALLGEILQQRAAEHGLTDRGYLDRLCTAWTAELATLAEAVTNNETYFFRNSEQFRVLSAIALPERVRARTRAATRELRLLSVGCSTGEEAYTLAMVAAESLPESRWDVSIIGLDINRGVLRKAMAGRYSQWSLRETPEAARQRWFHDVGDDVEIDARLRSRIRFVEHNVALDEPVLFAPGTYDVVLCRNLLMYLTVDTARAVVERITRALAPGGYLFLGHTDTLGGNPAGLRVHHSHQTFYYQREKPAPAPPPLTRERLSPPPHVPRRSPAAVRDQAMRLLREERYAGALAVADAIDGAEADRPDVWLIRAAALAHLGDTGRSADLCRRLLERDGLYADAHHLLAECHEGDGDPAAAVEHHRIAAHLDGGFAMPRLRLGLLARRLGDRQGAGRELDRAVALLPHETDERIVLFGGGFARSALIALCRAELAAVS